MNVNEKADEVVKQLRAGGFKGIRFPEIRPSMKESWTADYAIFGAVYYAENGFGECSEYFDHDRFRGEFTQHLKDQFPGCKVAVYWRSQEIEIYRKTSAA